MLGELSGVFGFVGIYSVVVMSSLWLVVGPRSKD